jgi:hypothetical protein
MGIQEYAKGWVAIATAVLVALTTVLGSEGTFGDLTIADWITVLLAALGAAGVVLVPNGDHGDHGVGPYSGGSLEK